MATLDNERGFTLVELMVTIAVLAIVTSIAIPSFSSIILNNRIAGTTQNIQSTLALTRSEAVKRNKPVRICRANSDLDDCAANGVNWGSGWLVKVDDEILKIGNPSSGIEVTGPGGTVEFLGSGMARATYEFDIKGKDQTRKLCITRSGTVKEAASCS